MIRMILILFIITSCSKGINCYVLGAIKTENQIIKIDGNGEVNLKEFETIPVDDRTIRFKCMCDTFDHEKITVCKLNPQSIGDKK